MKYYKKAIVIGITFLFLAVNVQAYQIKKPQSSLTNNTLYVDDDGDEAFTEIWDAVNHSDDGDTIYVYCGTYREHIIIDKSITLVGEQRDCVIIDGLEQDHNIITITAPSVTIKEVTIRNSVCYGINIVSNNNRIDHTKITRSSVHIDDADNNIITSNIFSDSALVLNEDSTYNEIIDNTVQGYMKIHADSNIIQDNQITTYGESALEIKGSSNIISGNAISNSKSSGYGIYLRQDSTANEFMENTIANCDWGFYVYEFASDNTIYHNNFKNNRIHQAWDQNANQVNNWDNGVEGNYWSNYQDKYPNAQDANGDGIWDNPYFISKENKDQYPFKEENGWRETPIPDLTCNDHAISWNDIFPGQIVSKTITIKNSGDPGSLLDWEITSYPSWGTWDFTPNEGIDLAPEDEDQSIVIGVTAPNEGEKEFTGSIIITNSENPADYCEISVSLITPKMKSLQGGDELDQEQNDDLGGGKPFYQQYWVAQGFTPTKEILTRVALRLFIKYNHPPDALVTVSIRSSKNGEDLTAVDVIGSTIESGAWIEFDFPDLQVIPGNTYFIVLRSSSGDEYNYHYGWYYYINNPYPSADAWGSRDSGDSWYELDFPENDLPKIDFCFKTYGRSNDAPSKPLITGPSSGKEDTSYDYTFYAVDPDGDQLYYFIDWGDGTNSDWIGPVASEDQIKETHVWHNPGEYEIKVKVKDIFDAESEWATLKINMPKNKIIDNTLWNYLLNHHFFLFLFLSSK